jgi:hypothetical protein
MRCFAWRRLGSLALAVVAMPVPVCSDPANTTIAATTPSAPGRHRSQAPVSSARRDGCDWWRGVGRTRRETRGGSGLETRKRGFGSAAPGGAVPRLLPRRGIGVEPVFITDAVAVRNPPSPKIAALVPWAAKPSALNCGLNDGRRGLTWGRDRGAIAPRARLDALATIPATHYRPNGQDPFKVLEAAGNELRSDRPVAPLPRDAPRSARTVCAAGAERQGIPRRQAWRITG